MASSSNPRRPRTSRTAPLALPPKLIARTIGYLQRGDVLLRIGLCFAAATIMCITVRGWAPPMHFYQGFTPTRDVVARVTFDMNDDAATNEARTLARKSIPYVYVNDTRALDDLQKALKDRVFQVLRAESFDKLDKEVWREFTRDLSLSDPKMTDEAMFTSFRKALESDPDLTKFENVVQQSLSGVRESGLLEKIGHKIEDGSQSRIEVRKSRDTTTGVYSVDDVRIAEVAKKLRPQIDSKFTPLIPDVPSRNLVALCVFNWLEPKLPTTLSPDSAASQLAADQAANNVGQIKVVFEKGRKLPGIDGGKPIDADALKLLNKEHKALLESLTFNEKLTHTGGYFGMHFALFTLCGCYIFFRQPQLLTDLRKLCTMLLLVVITVALCKTAAGLQWRAEIVPMLLLAMTVTIAYKQDLALLISACVALIVVVSLGHGLDQFVILVAAMATAIMMATRIRSRTKLIYVGMFTGVVAMLTALGVSVVTGQPLALPLLQTAGWFGFYSLVAGLLMTGLLPFIETLFDVRTDLSLLELGDQAHPLLQELVRRAPGTYNHSINVASIAEAAAESIGANGLLTRVGCYFHDIGKMLKPGYFVENQGQQGNRHESLVPAMSTLVIIAHVKDGADLARQHHLPQAIIDFIQQHHGTTLVEYFYNRANQQHEADPDSSQVDESSFRYPGPKPQTKEAAVMMLADASESASRALVDPAPARITGLVNDLAMKRLLDGQFDECGLTLQELRMVQDSLVKSLIAVYHGRIKYPSAATA